MANPINRNATMFQIQDMFENVIPDIVLKTVKGFILKNSFNNFDFREKVFTRNCCTRHS